MSLKMCKSLLASSLLLVGVAVVINGCSSSSSTGPDTGVADGGGSETSHPIQHKDASFDTGTATNPDAAAVVTPFDGTSGKACASNADCKGTGAGAPGINVCSNTYQFNTVNGVTTPQFWPTPLCLVPFSGVAGVGNCDPGPPGVLQFCDSADPNNLASPAICLPNTNPQQAGATNGLCLPSCSFGLDGSPATGCPGKDTCNPFTFLLSPTTSTVTGFGFCQGTCQADADCSALGTGWVCQTDNGFCTKAKKPRTKTLGSGCSNAGNGAAPIASSDQQTGACNCPFSGTATTSFYCTSACVFGGTPCPNGWTCDTFEPGQLVFTGAADGGGDIVLPGPSAQSPGLAGICMAPCNSGDAGAPSAGDAAATDAGAPADGGSLLCPGASNFPPLSTCRPPTDSPLGTAAGPDCVP
jgi:hypothetical protein